MRKRDSKNSHLFRGFYAVERWWNSWVTFSRRLHKGGLFASHSHLWTGKSMMQRSVYGSMGEFSWDLAHWSIVFLNDDFQFSLTTKSQRTCKLREVGNLYLRIPAPVFEQILPVLGYLLQPRILPEEVVLHFWLCM